MKIKRGSWIWILGTLLAGVLIYLLFRSPLSWMPPIFGWRHAVFSLSWMPARLALFVKCHLSDVL